MGIVQERQGILFERFLRRLPELIWNHVSTLVEEVNRKNMICSQRRGIAYE